jgi:hypothetical protein
LTPETALPKGLRAARLSQDGPLAEFAVFSEPAVHELVSATGLVDAHAEPLPFDETLKLLLLGEGGAGHDRDAAA